MLCVAVSCVRTQSYDKYLGINDPDKEESFYLQPNVFRAGGH
ncbi:unnamed protein product [Ectocarpus fasciculatus]